MPIRLTTSVAAFAAALLALTPASLAGQARPAAVAATESPYTFEEVMVPMRDGARLQTVILRPKDKPGPLPILLMRTPYGVPDAAPPQIQRSMQPLMEDGYILVFQNMRGRFKSDGAFAASTALDRTPNEATDAYDAVDWLVKNVPANNGRVGMFGVSYPGLAAAIALAEPHPALKAVSPQAAWADWWINDDLHRYGATRLSYAADWLYGLQADKNSSADFPYGGVWDTYDWFLKAGSLAEIDRRYNKGRVPAFTALVEHPDYDAHWKRERWIERLGKTTVPTLHVAGFWDQEDPWGSWQIYRKAEERDPDGLNHMIAGPWNHGSWRSKGDRLGMDIALGVETGTDFLTKIEAPFFRYWLHGKGTKPDYEAQIFQTGSNTWKQYRSWPPKSARATNLYLHTDGSLSFEAPRANGSREYMSDPAKPVPYRPRPISPTYPSPEWSWWEAGDQRFAADRTDVLVYVSEPLEADLTVSGEVAAMIFASTSGTDADVVVKLIDVYPDDAETPAWGERGPAPGQYAKSINGYQLPIAMEVRRGRWLDSWEVARPLTASTARAWDVPLRDRDHVFKRGHRIMVQIQSSWFPLIDRNPQRFVPNIGRAQPGDYIKATQRIWSGPKTPSRIVLPVVR